MRDGQGEREGVNEIGRADRDKKKEGGWLTWQWRHGAEDIRSSRLSLRTMCGRRCCQLCTWSGRPVAEPVRQRYEHYLHPSSSSTFPPYLLRITDTNWYSYTNAKEKQQTLENSISQIVYRLRSTNSQWFIGLTFSSYMSWRDSRDWSCTVCFDRGERERERGEWVIVCVCVCVCVVREECVLLSQLMSCNCRTYSH